MAKREKKATQPVVFYSYGLHQQATPGNPVIRFQRPGATATNTVYTDRMRGWDYEKYKELTQKHFGNQSDYWDNRSPSSIEDFMCEYLDKRVVLCMIEEQMQYDGYPVWRLDYFEQK